MNTARNAQEAARVKQPAIESAIFDDSWREVIRRRSEELRSGKVTPIPWEQVKQQARAKAAVVVAKSR